MAVRTQPRFAAWADPLYVFPMPDETPFGLDRSLVGRPVIDYTVSLLRGLPFVPRLHALFGCIWWAQSQGLA